MDLREIDDVGYSFKRCILTRKMICKLMPYTFLKENQIIYYYQKEIWKIIQKNFYLTHIIFEKSY